MKITESTVLREVELTLHLDYGLSETQALHYVEKFYTDPRIHPLVDLLVKYQDPNPDIIDEICVKIKKIAEEEEV